MAIDPKLVSIKTAGELPVSDPSENANFLFYEGETLQRSPMSNIYDKVSSGLLPATTTTVPSATGFERYIVHTAGTYTNFLSGGSPIVVTAADLDVVNGVANNRVILEVNNGVATKRIERVKGDAGENGAVSSWSAVAYSAGRQVLVDGMLYEANAATLATDIPAVSPKWIPKFTTYKIPTELTGQIYNGGTGLLQANPTYNSSVRMPVLPGMKFYKLFMNGFVKGIHFWDEQGNYIPPPFNVFSYEAPANAYEVAFTINAAANIAPETTEDFRIYQVTFIANKYAYIPTGSDLSRIYNAKNNTDANVLTGRFTAAGLSGVPEFRSIIIPISAGNITVKNLTTAAGTFIFLFDKNKLIYKRIAVTASEMTIDADDYTAFIGVSKAVNGSFTVINNTPLYRNVAKDLPVEIKIPTQNIFTNFKKGIHKFKIDFKLKTDINSGSGTLNIISGVPVAAKLFYAPTVSPANTQIPLLTHEGKVEINGIAEADGIPLGGANTSLFRGDELFRLRHTGTNYTLYWEGTATGLKLYSGTTLLAEYLYATYTTIGALIQKIMADSAATTIPAFEYYCSNASNLPTSKIAPFTKIQAFKTVTKDTGDVQSCFPTYFFAKDESWHTLEVIFRNSKTYWAIDGIAFNRPQSTVDTYAIGGEMVLDFTNFEYRNFKKEVGQEYSFPIVRTIYLHSAVDEMGETTGNASSTIDRTLYINAEFKKRGFKSISYTDLMQHMKFGKPIPNRSFVLCYDDSRIELYADKGVRTKLMQNDIKTNNCAVLSFDNDEETYVKSNDVVVVGTLVIGDKFNAENGSKMTYLGPSKIDGKHLFKIGNGVSMQSFGIVPNKTYTVGTGKSVNFPTAPFANIVRPEEIPYSEYTVLIQDAPNELYEYGFEVHIHDLKHAYLHTMTYDEAVTNVRDSVSLFRKRYKKFPTGIVYPYGAITPDHAKVWDNEGVYLGYNSTQNRHQLGAPKVNYLMDRFGLDVGNDVQSYFNNAFMGLDNFL